jgi:hypothetical protein
MVADIKAPANNDDKKARDVEKYPHEAHPIILTIEPDNDVNAV